MSDAAVFDCSTPQCSLERRLSLLPESQADDHVLLHFLDSRRSSRPQRYRDNSLCGSCWGERHGVALTLDNRYCCKRSLGHYERSIPPSAFVRPLPCSTLPSARSHTARHPWPSPRCG